jgi:catecholate siderophore receptor
MNKLNKFYPRKQLMDNVIRIFNVESTGANKQPLLNAFPLGALLASLTLPHPLHAEEAQASSKQKAKSSNESVADNNKEQTLPEVSVKADSELEKKSYQATKTRVGKTVQDPYDIPQAITTITHDLMHDQQVGTLREALRNVSGLTFNAAEGGRSGDNFNLRGFYTFGDIYLDGIRDTAQYNRETFNLEQVDVLRGSAAMLFGRGQAGGVINQVSKMAKLKDENVVSGSVGNYGYHQETGDFNKQLSDTMAIRLNVMDRKEETYRTNPSNGVHPKLDRQGISLSFGAGIGTDNEFYLNHVYTKTRDIPDFGISFFNKKPINTSAINDKTFYGSASNFDNSDTNITTAIFTHKFNNDSEWRTQLRSADYERSYWAKTPSATLTPTNNGTVGGNVTRVSDYETLTLQSDYSNKFDFVGMKHQFLAGAEYLNESSKRNSLQAFNPKTGQAYTATGNALNALIAANGIAYQSDVASFTGAGLNQFKADNYALYAQDTVTIAPKWDVLLGVRRDEMRANYSSSTSPKLNYGENSYRTGLSWHQSETQHYYLSYSDSFSPTADLYQLTTSPLPPERSTTLELGHKWLLRDGDLAFRTAIYTTTKDWERNADLEATAAILTKKRRTNGVEFELSGELTKRLIVFAGLSLMDAKILEVAENVNATTGVITVADQRFAGQQARNTPDATFNLWATYSLMDHWKVGAGVEAKGERYGYVPSQATAPVYASGSFDPNRLPGYARVDVIVAYEEKKWALRFNVKNLLDKTYYDALYDNGGFSTPGNRRQAILTAEYKF